MEKEDVVNNPSHYKLPGGKDVLDYTSSILEIMPAEFCGCAFNAIKYVSRAPKKGALVQDLEKALYYLRYFKKRYFILGLPISSLKFYIDYMEGLVIKERHGIDNKLTDTIKDIEILRDNVVVSYDTGFNKSINQFYTVIADYVSYIRLCEPDWQIYVGELYVDITMEEIPKAFEKMVNKMIDTLDGLIVAIKSDTLDD